MKNAAAAIPQEQVFLKKGGKLGALIAEVDWGSTSLGPISTWSPSMKSVVSLVLASPIPIVTLWHESGYMIYNDAYAAFAADRHPGVLGGQVRLAWPEIAEFNGHIMELGLAGNTLSCRDQEMTLYRNGKAEPVWLNLDYSPILDEQGTPVAVMAVVMDTTAKVRAERQLQAERKHLHSMFAQAPGMMALLRGPEHIFELANAAYMQLIGHREVRGKRVRDALPEIEGQGLFERLDTAFRSGEAYSGQCAPVWLQRTPGARKEQRFLDFVFQPVKDNTGEVIGIFVQGMDVTDRILVERALRASEGQFRSWAQAMPNHVWTSLPDGRVNWFNQQMYHYSGAKFGELDEGRWINIVHPDDQKLTKEKWSAAIASDQIYEFQFRLRRHDGAYRWHLVRAVPIRDGDEITHWLGTNTDIENQKATADALASLNATLEQQVERRTAERDRMWRLSRDIMLVAYLDGHIVAVNPALNAILGWTQDETIGVSLLQLVHPDDRAATQSAMRTSSQGANTFRFENRCRHKDGHYRNLSWTAVPDANYVHAVGRDVTDDRAAAAALASTQAALLQAQKMEALGNLTGGVAHDFNNLLQVISGNLQLLEIDLEGREGATRKVFNALAAVKRGADLASYLLAFGRRQALEPRVVSIGEHVAGMQSVLERTLGEGIEIRFIVADELWNAYVDTTQVENAVFNLCINARDAMDGMGKLTIEVGNTFLDERYARTYPDVTAGHYVALSVSDTGSGMTPEVLAQACEPFFSTKPQGQGTGLGLSMVYGFIKQSGGHLKIDSAPGRGTTVRLYIPRSLEPHDNSFIPLHEPSERGGGETVLVAEDDDEVRSIVVEMLGGMGYRVLVAHDAASALEIIQEGAQVDILFTDVVMPGPLRSPEMALRARKILPDLAVLFTSGYTENAITHGGRLDRDVDLLSKPYTQAALAAKIRHVLGKRHVRNRGAVRVD